MRALLVLLAALVFALPAVAQDPVNPGQGGSGAAQTPTQPADPADPDAEVKEEPEEGETEADADADTQTDPSAHLDPTLKYMEGVKVRISQVEIGAFPTVHAFVSVEDPSGVQIRTLAAADFMVTENGEAVGDLRFGNRDELDLPLAVMFALDISGSMEGDPLELAKAAVRDFIGQLQPRDRVGLVTFSDSEMPEVTLTEEKELVLNRMDDLSAWGQTALWNGLYMAMHELVSDPQPARRALIVLSDGIDNRSIETPQTILKWYEDNALAQNLGFSVYTLGLGYDIDRPALSRIAERTGGQFLESPTPEELSAVHDAILSQIQSEYLLEYESQAAAQPGQIIDVQVGVAPVASFDPGTYTYRSPGLTGALARALWPGLIAIVVVLILLIIFTFLKLSRKAWLTVMLTPLEGKDYSLSPAGAAIGSSEGANIRVGRDPAMLGYHATLKETSDGYLLEAADPDAPILMGQRMLSRKLLRSGDRFILGTTKFVFNEKIERPGEAMLEASGVETELAAIVQSPATGTPAAQAQPAPAAKPPKALVGPKGRQELNEGQLSIGRTEGDIVLAGDQQVSRKHAVIHRQGERVWLVDSGSTNGTFVNGARVQPGIEQPLSAGDTLRVGQTEFRLE